MKSWTYRLLQPFLILLGIFIASIIGYVVIEADILFWMPYTWTTITVTTAGFQEVRPLSDGGKIFTITSLIASWASFAFALTRITQFVTSGEINKYFKTRRIMKEADKLHGHVIICGYGRNGQQAGHAPKIHNVPFVVIERTKQEWKGLPLNITT